MDGHKLNTLTTIYLYYNKIFFLKPVFANKQNTLYANELNLVSKLYIIIFKYLHLNKKLNIETSIPHQTTS